MVNQSSQFTATTKYDYLYAFPDGMDSGVAPSLLPKTQLAYASNATVRGTFVGQRPVRNKLTLAFDGSTDAQKAALQQAVTKALFQGATYYKLDDGTGSLVASIAGRLFQFFPNANGTDCAVVERTGGNPQNAAVVQAWLWQAENYVFWNDGTSLPVFYNGTTNTTARSIGNLSGTVANWSGGVLAVPTPPGAFSIPTVEAAPAVSPGQILNLWTIGQFQVVSTGANVINATNISIPYANVIGGPLPISFPTGKPQFPPGRMGCYGMGRVWMCLTDGRTFLAGDIVNGASGTASFNGRDAILYITENNFLLGGGVFTIPVSGDVIRAMRFATTLDASLGQGPLQIYLPTSVFSCQAPVDRTTWSTITNPILTQSLIGQGALGQNSTIAANGDTFFRSLVGCGSLILGRRNFATWGNVPISREMTRTLITDPQALLQYGSAVNFDNRLLMTTHPVNGPLGIYHKGFVVINFDPLSNIHGKAPSVWDGTWPGMNCLQVLVGEFDSIERCYQFCYNVDTNEIELWEQLRSPDQSESTFQFSDNFNADPVYWWFESPVLKFGEEVPQQRTFKKLVNGEIFVDKLKGRVKFEAFYRPDQYPCWIPWLTWEECAKDTVGQVDQPQFRTRMGLGMPTMNNCEPNMNRPYPLGYTFQFKLVITGHCEFTGARFMATVEPEPSFPVSCNTICV